MSEAPAPRPVSGQFPMAFRGLWWICHRFVLAVFWLAYRPRRSGMEHIPARGPFIIAVNHQSHLDPLLAGLLFSRRPFMSIARSGLFSFGPFAWLIRRFGAIPIRRGMGDAAAIRATLAALEAGRPVLVFPEGTRTRDGGLGEFQRGITVLLKRASVPVLPVALDGAHALWPIGRRFPRLTGRLATCAGEPIDCKELMRDGPDAALEILKRRIETMRLRLREELRAATAGRFPDHDAGDQPYWESCTPSPKGRGGPTPSPAGRGQG